MATACAQLRCWPAPVTCRLRQHSSASRSLRWAGSRCDRQRHLLPPLPPPATAPVTHVRAAVVDAPPASQSYGLRDYQEEAIETIVDQRAAGVTRQLVSLPTGSGKTVIMCHLAKRLAARTLVLVHRTEIVGQTVAKMRAIWPSATVGILSAQSKTFDAQVVVASVQTATREKTLNRLVEQGFELIIVDEAHHAPAKSYTTVISGFGFETGSYSEEFSTDGSQENSSGEAGGEGQADAPGEDAQKASEDAAVLQLAAAGSLLVGFTATPVRLDGVSLGVVFQKLVFQRDIQYMVGRGYLEPSLGVRIMTSEDLSDVKQTKEGDFRETELEVYVNTRERNLLAVLAYLDHAAGRPAIVFCVGIQHALDMRDVFLEAGITCEAVFSKGMPDDERAAILHRFRTGETQVLTNCMILTEGFDEPSVSCVVMARPTRSKGLYMQCIGRGLRPHPGKSDCIVIDLTDYHHDLSAPLSLGDIWCPPPTSEQPDLVGLRDDGHIGGDRTTAKVRLNALPSGDLELLQPRFGWMHFGNTGHFVLDVTPPQHDKGHGSTDRSEKPASEAAVKWYIWMLACHPQRRLARLPGQLLGDTAGAAGTAGSDIDSDERQPLYMVHILKLESGSYSWLAAKPGADTRDKRRPPRPTKLQAALCAAEAMVIDDFREYADKADTQPKASPRLGLQLSRWLGGKPAARSKQKNVYSYSDGLALAKLKGLAEDFFAGRLCIPQFEEFYV